MNRNVSQTVLIMDRNVSQTVLIMERNVSHTILISPTEFDGCIDVPAFLRNFIYRLIVKQHCQMLTGTAACK